MTVNVYAFEFVSDDGAYSVVIADDLLYTTVSFYEHDTLIEQYNFLDDLLDANFSATQNAVTVFMAQGDTYTFDMTTGGIIDTFNINDHQAGIVAVVLSLLGFGLFILAIGVVGVHKFKLYKKMQINSD